MLSTGTYFFADLSYLFIYSIFFFLGGQSDKQLWATIHFQMDDNLFSSSRLSFCQCVVTSGKEQGSELCLTLAEVQIFVQEIRG